ncbi:hypothetical protein [Francisella philomiragia]|uniref:hypothetical protein n=1 Tax=Francisella philomiragia TaxID=28110 RepID=UPI0035141850
MNNQPIIRISPAFKGCMTVADLLSTEGTITFAIDNESINNEGTLFQVIDENFIFALSFQNNSMVFQRNETISILTLEHAKKENIMFFVMWSHKTLTLQCKSNSISKKAEIPTTPVTPPLKLIKYARKNTLLSIESYKTEEEFREKIHSCLLTINQKIRETDAYKSFWNISYEGNRIVERIPKKEVDIQPLIHCLLSDQMLLSNIEVIPEYKTGVGNLDFLFIGNVEGVGMCKFCAEFKLAHSSDLDNGLWHQLPKYMEVSQANYGAYCVLNFKGSWFDLPNLKNENSLDIHLSLIPKDKKLPVHSNIRFFIFELAKIITASKKL